MEYSVLLEKVHILAVWRKRKKKRNKNISDVIVLPPSGPPLLHQCFSNVLDAATEKQGGKKNVFYLKKKTLKRKCEHFVDFEWLLICTASLFCITW